MRPERRAGPGIKTRGGRKVPFFTSFRAIPRLYSNDLLRAESPHRLRFPASCGKSWGSRRRGGNAPGEEGSRPTAPAASRLRLPPERDKPRNAPGPALQIPRRSRASQKQAVTSPADTGKHLEGRQGGASRIVPAHHPPFLRGGDGPGQTEQQTGKGGRIPPLRAAKREGFKAEHPSSRGRARTGTKALKNKVNFFQFRA